MAKKKRHPADAIRPGEKLVEIDEGFAAYVNEEFGKRPDPGKKKVLVASLTLTMIPNESHATHCINFYQLGRDHPDYSFSFITLRRASIADSRNNAVKFAISGGFDYLYFFDDDTVNDRDVLGRLLPRMEEFNAISAGYFVRGYPFNPMVFRWAGENGKHHMRLYSWNEYKKHVDKDNVLRHRVSGVGCGCTLFRVEDFKNVPYPWFYTGHGHTEDAWWFTRAAEHIEDYKVGMDFNICCGHLCDPIYVDSYNVDTVRRFHRKLKKMGGML